MSWVLGQSPIIASLWSRSAGVSKGQALILERLLMVLSLEDSYLQVSLMGQCSWVADSNRKLF